MGKIGQKYRTNTQTKNTQYSSKQHWNLNVEKRKLSIELVEIKLCSLHPQWTNKRFFLFFMFFFTSTICWIYNVVVNIYLIRSQLNVLVEILRSSLNLVWFGSVRRAHNHSTIIVQSFTFEILFFFFTFCIALAVASIAEHKQYTHGMQQI